jgi:hypothetical protein
MKEYYRFLLDYLPKSLRKRVSWPIHFISNRSLAVGAGQSQPLSKYFDNDVAENA